MPMRVTGLTSGLDTESIISALVSAYDVKTQKYTKAQTKLSWTQDAWKSLNTKVYSLYTNVSNLRFSSAYSTKKATVSDATKASVTASSDAVNGTHKLSINSIAQSGYMTGGKVNYPVSDDGEEPETSKVKMSDLGYTGGDTSFQVKLGNGDTKDIKLSASSTITDVVAALREAGVNANFDEKQKRFYISSKTSGADADFNIVPKGDKFDDDGNTTKYSTDSYNLLYTLGFANAGMAAMTDDPVGTDNKRYATKIDGQDSSITLDGVEYTNSDNAYSINGLSINALAETDGEITIQTATDTQAIYDKIKDFLTEYNNIINEMTKLYNADSSYGYDPLTDEEKDAMSDTEIEKWETKIKDSLLRNDTTLNGVMMAMINSMSASYEINGEKYSLSSFGISTLGYLNAADNENYAYHIDGDADDENTSSKEDKLMKAITESPDAVIEFMKKLTSGLYTDLGNKMKSTALSSAYTIYNDKEMNSQYSEYSKTISTWQDKLTEKEDYYYNKFAQMESALTKLQSQTSSLSGLFGSSS